MSTPPSTTNERPPLHANWQLDPTVTFLNHGSFGACPRAVLEYQRELRDELEAQPVDFFVRRFADRLDEARAQVARFVGADPEGLAFVPNATTGVNSVLGSLTFEPGDELVVTDQGYNACSNALRHHAERAGAIVRVARVPFPLQSEDQVVDAVLAECGPKTRLALVDHVTSPTGLVLPIARIREALDERGIDLLVDGAHAPGMLPLELDALGAAYYTGNCHKWICAPKGAAILWVRADRREATRPAVISHGANASTEGRPRFRHEFDWIGTIDPTPWLSIPKAIEVVGGLVPGGWPEVMRHNRELVLEARELLCDALDQPAPAPASMIGSLATVLMPDGGTGARVPLYEDEQQAWLWREHRIEVPIGCWPAPPKRFLRVSAQLYNCRADYERLIAALTEWSRRES